jgi:O-antigen/teichoic acid export membrane protein
VGATLQTALLNRVYLNETLTFIFIHPTTPLLQSISCTWLSSQVNLKYMQTLRKQTILSSVFMILGFVFGAITVLLYTKYAVLSKAEVGLTKIITDFAQLAIAFASLGLLPVLHKFYPYYNDNLPPKKNELLTIIISLCLIGFLFFCVVGFFIKPIVVRKYSGNSPLVVDYYPYLFLFALGMLLFTAFETFAFVKHRSIASNFLKETALRFLTVLLMIFLMCKVIAFNQFILLYSLQSLAIFFILFWFLKRKEGVYFNFEISRVTKKFWKKMLSMQLLLYSGFIIITLTTVIDAFVLGAKKGAATVGDYTLAQYGANLVSIPAKAMLGGSIGILTQAWKDKNLVEIKRIYNRSCINLSLMALFLLGNIWLNVVPLIDTLHIDATWKIGMNTMFFICVARTIDASTGVNNLIIGTSTFWKFEFITGMTLLAIRLPTTLFLISKYGLIGSAFADIISITIYNLIRFEYLRRKYNMQPFNYKNVLAVLLAVMCYFIAFYCCKNIDGIVGIIARATLFSTVFIAGIFTLNLTPDAMQLWNRWVK